MPFDLEKIVGVSLPDIDVSWNKRDILTYAVGVGAKADDMPFVYELAHCPVINFILNASSGLALSDPNFSALPTYPVVLNLKQNSQELNLFKDRTASSRAPAGLPPLDPNRMLHGSQSIEVIKKLPVASGPGWKWKSRYSGVSENKTGLVLMVENTLVDATGAPYAKLYSSTFNLGAKANGTPFSKYIAGPPSAKKIPAREPDWIIKDQTSPEQALIFRLSGDYNPLHIDPSIGQAAGFNGVILHGLSTFGFTARGLIKTIGGNNPEALKLFGVRFTSPVQPGDALETRVWEVGTLKDGTTEVAFETKCVRTGKVSLGGGVAYIVKKSQGAKL